MRSVIRKSLVFFTGVIISLCLFELSLHLVGFFVKPYREEAKYQDDGKALIFCLGDSYTLGYGLPYEKSYPAILDSMLKDKGYRVKNLGLAAANTSMSLKVLKEEISKGNIPDIVTLQCGEANLWNDNHSENEFDLRIRKFMTLIIDFFKEKNNGKGLEEELEILGESKKSSFEEFDILMKETSRKKTLFKKALLDGIAIKELKDLKKDSLEYFIYNIFFGNKYIKIESNDLSQTQKDLLKGIRYSLDGDYQNTLRSYIKVLKSSKTKYRVMEYFWRHLKNKALEDLPLDEKILRFKDRKKIITDLERPFDIAYLRSFLKTYMQKQINKGSFETEVDLKDSFYLWDRLIAWIRPESVIELESLYNSINTFYFSENESIRRKLFCIILRELELFRKKGLDNKYIQLVSRLKTLYEKIQNTKKGINKELLSHFYFELYLSGKDPNNFQNSLKYIPEDKTETPFYFYDLIDYPEHTLKSISAIDEWKDMIDEDVKLTLADIFTELGDKRGLLYDYKNALALYKAAIDLIEDSENYWRLAWIHIVMNDVRLKMGEKKVNNEKAVKYLLTCFKKGINKTQAKINLRGLYDIGIEDKFLKKEVRRIIRSDKIKSGDGFEKARDWLEKDYLEFIEICDKYSIRFIGVGYAHTRNIILEEICDSSGCEYIEFKGLFDELLKKQSKEKYFLGDGHFSFTANQFIAKILKERILDE